MLGSSGYKKKKRKRGLSEEMDLNIVLCMRKIEKVSGLRHQTTSVPVREGSRGTIHLNSRVPVSLTSHLAIHIEQTRHDSVQLLYSQLTGQGEHHELAISVLSITDQSSWTILRPWVTYV